MEMIKNWAFSVSVAAITGGMLNMIFPDFGTQKTFRAIVSVFFISVLISPLAKIEIPEFGIFSKNELIREEQDENEFIGNSEAALEKRIAAIARESLQEKGYFPKDISLKVNISAEGSIDIIEFSVFAQNGADGEEMKKIVFEKTGIEPEIVFSEGK